MSQDSVCPESIFFYSRRSMHRVIYLAYKNEIFFKKQTKVFFLTAIFLNGLFLIKALSISFLQPFFIEFVFCKIMRCYHHSSSFVTKTNAIARTFRDALGVVVPLRGRTDSNLDPRASVAGVSLPGGDGEQASASLSAQVANVERRERRSTFS